MRNHFSGSTAVPALCFHLGLHLPLLFKLPFQSTNWPYSGQWKDPGHENNAGGLRTHVEPYMVAICNALILGVLGFCREPLLNCGTSWLVKLELLWVSRKLNQPHWFGVGRCGLSLLRPWMGFHGHSNSFILPAMNQVIFMEAQEQKSWS